ncbi:HAD family hydrolase [Streptomyces sediminimaris]|uniref:HAD family hydrolase n=1 Tax=Streptomyces sediminimaris TaxID=3383721 RepID=UPI00399AE843
MEHEAFSKPGERTTDLAYDAWFLDVGMLSGERESASVQRLVFFGLDNTLVDRQSAFATWVTEFAEERGLGHEAVPWLKAADGQSQGARDQFFRAVREHYGLAEPAEELWAGYRARMPELVRCAPEVLEGLSQLQASGWRVGIVSNGKASRCLDHECPNSPDSKVNETKKPQLRVLTWG